MDQNQKARQTFFATLGEVQSHQIAEMSPGGGQWPGGTSARWTVIKKNDQTIVASDGLSDLLHPADKMNGFGLELLMATTEKFDRLENSWLLQALRELGQQVVNYGNLDRDLEELGVVSTELASVRNVPEDFISSRGTIGVLLGIKSQDVAATCTGVGKPIPIVIARFLKRAELEGIMEFQGEARDKIRAHLESQPHPHAENLARSTTPDFSQVKGTTSAMPPLPKPKPPGGTPSPFLMIQGLSDSVSESEIKDLFGNHGQVLEVKRVKSLNMTLVKMATADEGERAASALNGSLVKGQPILIAYAQKT